MDKAIYTETIEKLTIEDLSQLKKKTWQPYIALVFLVALFGFLIKLLVFLCPIAFPKDRAIDPFAIIFYSAFFLLAFSLPVFGIRYFVKRFLGRRKELEQGVKHVLTGILSDKQVVVSTSTSDSDSSDSGPFRGGGGIRISTNTTTYDYFLYMGKRKFEVDKDQFYQVTVGKMLAVHYTPITQTIIFLKKL
jgi:hypothetical protein